MNTIKDLSSKIKEVNENCSTDFQKFRAFNRMKGIMYKLTWLVENVTVEGKVTGFIADTNEEPFEVEIAFDLSDKEMCKAIAQVEKGETVEIQVKTISIVFTEEKDIVLFEIKNVRRL